MKKVQQSQVRKQPSLSHISAVQETIPTQLLNNAEPSHNQYHSINQPEGIPKSKHTQNVNFSASRTVKNKLRYHQKEQDNQKISDIIRQKKQLNQQLVRLHYQQVQLKEKSKNNRHRNQRSHITKSQIIAIHRALEARKQFQKVCDNKNQLLQKQIRQNKIKQEQEKQQQMQRIRQFKKEESSQNLKQIKRRQLQRSRQIRQRNQVYQQVKEQKYTHQKLQQEWENSTIKQKILEKNKIRQLSESRAVPRESIAEHQHKYIQRRLKEQQQRQEQFKLEKLSRLKVQKMTLSKFEPSKFLRTIFEQQQEKKRKAQEQTMKTRTYSLKKTQYGESVRKSHINNWKNKHLKPIKQNAQVNKSRKLQKPSPHKRKSESISQFQIMKIGNDYMREIHSSIGYSEGSCSNCHLKDTPIVSSYKYQDYLTPMRKKRQSSQINNPQTPEIKQLKKVMQRQISLQDKIYQVKMISTRLDNKSRPSDSKTMLASINAKISLINNLIQAQQTQ